MSGPTCRWPRIRRSVVRFSELAGSPHCRSSADCIINIAGFSFRYGQVFYGTTEPNAVRGVMKGHNYDETRRRFDARQAETLGMRNYG